MFTSRLDMTDEGRDSPCNVLHPIQNRSAMRVITFCVLALGGIFVVAVWLQIRVPADAIDHFARHLRPEK